MIAKPDVTWTTCLKEQRQAVETHRRLLELQSQIFCMHVISNCHLPHSSVIECPIENMFRENATFTLI